MKKILSIIISESGAVLLTAVAGFYMIHALSKCDYGVYAFLISTVGLIIALSEIGINHCFLPTIGTGMPAPNRVATVMSIFSRKRFRLIIWSTFLVIPVALLLIYRQGWLSWMNCLSLIVMLLGVWVAVQEQLWRMGCTALRLVRVIAISTTCSAGIRSVWIIGAVAVFNSNHLMIPMALAGGIGSMVGLFVFRSLGRELRSHDLEPKDIQYSLVSRFQQIYKPLWLPAVTWILYANFGGIVIAWFADVETIADVNATSRLVMMLILLDKIANIFVFPRLAQAKTEHEYRVTFVKFQTLHLLVLCLIAISSWLLPEYWLMLLGEKYKNLSTILWLGMLGPLLANSSGFTFSCLASRGYTSNQMPILITGVFIQIIMVLWIGMKTATDIFIVGAVSSAVFAIGQWLLMIKQISGVKTSGV